MRKVFVVFALCILVIFTMCESPSKSDEENQHFDIFVLCEGNFGSANATLWALDDNFENIAGPIYWDTDSNPLGDVGQSLRVYNNRLYIVMNGSHTIEVLNLSNGINYELTIEVPNASPREIEIMDGIGYLTCWNLNGILSIELESGTILDTIILSDIAQPEDIVCNEGKLYTSIKQNSDWSAGHQIFEITIDTIPLITDSFEVIPGPDQMLIHGGFLYVVSTHFDSEWNSNTGLSRIDLFTGEVVTKEYGITSSFGEDIALYQERVYRTWGSGIVPFDENLNLIETEKIGNLSGIYSMATYENYIFLGITNDWVAPDTVIVLDSDGSQVASFQVGALPGSFEFFAGH
jgi:hypothetical protein